MSVKNPLTNRSIDHRTIGTIAGFAVPVFMVAGGFGWLFIGDAEFSTFQNLLLASLWIFGGAISAPLYIASVGGWGWG